MAEVKGGSRAVKALNDIAAKLGSGSVVRVGFLEGATYPVGISTKKLRAKYSKKKTAGPITSKETGGQQVAFVAAMNEFGHGNVPPRPFFRNMITEKKGEWPAAISNLLVINNYDVNKTLGQIGEAISRQLRESIVALDSPPLAESTIAAKGFSKPLVDTSHMLMSVDFEVKST